MTTDLQLSSQEQQVLLLLSHIRSNLQRLNTSLEEAITTTGPGGDMYEAQQEAIRSLDRWSGVLKQKDASPGQ